MVKRTKAKLKAKGGRPAGDKEHAGGRWTSARKKTFIKNLLRSGCRKWAPIGDAKKSANVRRGFYKCAGCLKVVTASLKVGRERKNNVFVDHIDPIIDPETGFTTWDSCVERMYCEEDGLQVLCKACHKEKSKGETDVRTTTNSNRKLYPREESSWKNMKSRCDNPKATGYKSYGGRGINYQDSWSNFESFYEDMGERPEETSLDRIDFNGNYTKENCRWATRSVQGNNKSNNHVITYLGESLTISEWSSKLGIKDNTICYRILRGWTISETLGFTDRLTPSTSRIDEELWEHMAYLREDQGVTTVLLGEMYGIDPSQVSRKTKKYMTKTKEETDMRTAANRKRKESKGND